MTKFCITFAGAPGTSKTPISNYLSVRFGLPVLNNDATRTEVIEDFGVLDEAEYISRRNERANIILESGKSFIYDASVDRQWETLSEWLVKHDYSWFIISMDLSKELLVRIYRYKNYEVDDGKIDQLLADHDRFLNAFGEEVRVRITDDTFKDRLAVAYEAVKGFAGERRFE